MKPSIPTILTVLFHSPSLPTNSHFPVTSTSPRGALLEVEVVLGLVVLTGLVDGDELVAGADLFPQAPLPIISPINPVANITLLIICFFSLQFLNVFRVLNYLPGKPDSSKSSLLALF